MTINKIDDDAIPTTRRKLPWVIALLTLLFLGTLTLIAMGTLLAAFWMGDAEPQVVWVASSGEPIPENFSYLAFPKNSDVPLARQDGSMPGIKLTRAFACTESERHKGGHIGVWESGQEWMVSKRQIEFVPSGSNAETLVTNWKNTVQGWSADETDYRTVDASWEKISEDAFRVTLQMTTRKGTRYEYVYVAAPGILKPESSSILKNTAANLAH
ncbi:MAG: hypothetical protein DHS20C16_26850 [Phycisphaerae bacterium]|nr:MAG: hypothetical protein DHS20C16_26850 [Phycisphaerae bacterium]